MCECLEKSNWMQICLDGVSPATAFAGGKRDVRVPVHWGPQGHAAALDCITQVEQRETERGEEVRGKGKKKDWGKRKVRQKERWTRRKEDKRCLNKDRRWFVKEMRGLTIYCCKRPDIQTKREKSSWQCLQEDDLYQWSDSVGLWMCVCVGVWLCDRGILEPQPPGVTGIFMLIHPTYALSGVWP